MLNHMSGVLGLAVGQEDAESPREAGSGSFGQ